MADELDPRLEARLRDMLRHEADALPFTLTFSDLEATRRERGSVRARLRLPGSILAAAAAIVILVVAATAWRTTPQVGMETASPDPRAAELESYADLAARLPTEGGQVVLAQGEDLAGAAPGTGPKETVIGTIPANAYVDWVFDCRGNSVSVSLRRGQEAPGGAMVCGQQPTVFSFPGFDTPSEVVVTASTSTVWRLVVGGMAAGEGSGSPAPAPPTSPTSATQDPALAGLATFEELERLPSAPRSVLVRGEGTGGTTILGDIAGAVPLRVAVACGGTSGEIRVQQGADRMVNETTVACRPEGVTASIDARALTAPVNQVTVIAPTGTAWRLVAGTDEIAGPTPPADLCALLTEATQPHHPVVMRDTFDGFEKGQGLVVWSGDGEPPDTAATWDDSDGQGEFAAYHGVSTFQLDAGTSCLAGWRIEYAPTDAVEAARASGAPPGNVTIAVDGTADGPVHVVDFDLPDRGHYIVRATLTWLLEDGSVGRDVRLWRLWTDAAEFYPDVPHPDPVASCGTPDASQPAPPALTMALDGNEVATGVRMNGRWNGTLAAGGPTEVPADVIQLPSGTGLVLETAGDVCAMAWTVTYGPVPATLDSFEPAGETLALQGNPSMDPAYARENHIALGDLPPGEWIVQANLVFPDGGSRTWFRVRVGV